MILILILILILITALLAFIAYALDYLVDAKKPLLTRTEISKTHSIVSLLHINKTGSVNILKSCLLVVLSGCFLLASLLGYQLTMMAFINSSLLVSILACVIGLSVNSKLTRLIQKSIMSWLAALHPTQSYLDSQYLANRSQFLSSFASFISFTHFLYRCLFYNNFILVVKSNFGQAISTSLVDIQITAGIYVLSIFIWCYLSLRFLRLAVSCNYVKESKVLTIPLLPVIIFKLYLSSLSNVFSLSWVSFKSQSAPVCSSAAAATFYSFAFTLLNPTKSVEKLNLSDTLCDKTIFVASPSENSFFDFKGLFVPLTQTIFSRLAMWEREGLSKAEDDLRAKLKPIRTIGELSTDPKLKKVAETYEESVINLQSPHLNLKQQTDLVTQAEVASSKLAYLLSLKNECEGTPRSGIVNQENQGPCFEKYVAKLNSTTTSITEIGENVAGAIEKAI
jgi:hypothetical protein